MSLESDCPYCGRVVGVVQRLTIGGVSGNRYKQAVHAVGAPSKGRRPRCVHGSGMEVDRSALREAPISAATRKMQQYREGRKAAGR